MAFSKYANATIVKPEITAEAWDGIRQQALVPATDFQQRTAKVVLQEYDPKQFLLSHCTIIASVDTEKVAAPMGKHMVDGFQINRQYEDYHLTPETAKYVNNNNDAWERTLLLACFKTFIGGENYVEHIQIPEMSKGKILDAAARNIGESVYVDILVATDRKHQPLIRAITSGELGTLSMGCSVDFTICTKCGNVAEDETHLCPHIRYFKGSEFVDEMGKKRKIAELCGHISAEPGTVKFIEASWVANPAFKGAVLRNILSTEEIAGLGAKMHMAFNEPPRVAEPDMMQRAARSLLGQEEQTLPDEGGEAPPEAPPGGGEEESADPLDKIVDDLADNLKTKVVEKVRKQIDEGEAAKVREILDENASNESLIKSALQHPEWQQIAKLVSAKVGRKNATSVLLGLIFHKKGGWKAVRAANRFSGVDILAISRVLDMATKRSFQAGEARIFRTVVAVGGTGPYADVETYLAACRQELGRTYTGSEAAALIEKGRLFSLGL